MRQLARVGDPTTGHDCFGPQVITSGSSNVFIDGIPAARVGDSVSSHTCGSNTHAGVIMSLGLNIFINGMEAAVTGSPISCGGTVASGSPSTSAN